MMVTMNLCKIVKYSLEWVRALSGSQGQTRGLVPPLVLQMGSGTILSEREWNEKASWIRPLPLEWARMDFSITLALNPFKHFESNKIKVNYGDSKNPIFKPCASFCDTKGPVSSTTPMSSRQNKRNSFYFAFTFWFSFSSVFFCSFSSIFVLVQFKVNLLNK